MAKLLIQCFNYEVRFEQHFWSLGARFGRRSEEGLGGRLDSDLGRGLEGGSGGGLGSGLAGSLKASLGSGLRRGLRSIQPHYLAHKAQASSQSMLHIKDALQLLVAAYVTERSVSF